jgi:hypothetical protein
MARTIRRQPIELSTSSSNYPRPYYFNQAQFKGLSTEQNDITIDQQTFADANNLYIDENGVLVSRLPFKFDGTDAYIVERWDFGRYHLMLQRFLCEQSGDDFVQVDDTSKDNLFFVFKLSCYTTEVLDEYTWSFPVVATGSDYFPEVTCSQVEDKIFVWFAGIDFLCFNTIISTFEDASKYIYLPIRELITNGISAEFESENFLTQSYRRRHQLSVLSGIDYPSLYNRQLSVYSGSASLYNVQLKAGFENVLIHPSFYIGNYHIDFVETPRGLVILRYDIATRNMSVSFGTGIFHNIPQPVNQTIVKEPVLTRDGLSIVVYTYSALYMYDLSTADVSNGSWTRAEYGSTMSRIHWTEEFGNKDELSGYFETADVYVFTGRDYAGDLHIYSRISDGANGYVEKDTLVGDTNLDLSFYKKLRLTGDLTVINDEFHVSIVGVHKNTNIPRILICGIHKNTETTDISEMPCNYKLNTNLSDCGFAQLSEYNVLFSGNFDVDGAATDMHFYRQSSGLPTPPIQIPIVSNKFFATTDGKCITDKYIWDIHAGYAPIPNIITSKDMLSNGDRLTLGTFSANVYSATPASATSDITLSSMQITSGGLIFWAPHATATEEYVEGYGDILNVFSIERLSIKDGEFVVSTGEIRSGDFVRLTAVISGIADRTPYCYPTTPSGWEVGDDWPDTFPPYKPLFVEADNSTREWEPGDALPAGPIIIYGNADITGDVTPLHSGEDVWYDIGGRLWTSALQEDTLLEIDEYVNGLLNSNVPSHTEVMNEYYFSYDVNNEHLLEVTEARRDEKTHNDFLLYLPKKNEQKFSSKITALHHLSDSEMGIFTENEIWYTSVGTLNDTLVYTKPIRSKIPTGLRDGDEVVTALDGQAVIFPSERGLVALAPQDFIATTEKTLSYISDSIQSLYQELYKSDIRIDTYKYFLLFHRHFGRDIIAFDTRNSSWWRWQTPYPIRSLFTNDGLRPLLQIDFRGTKPSLLGVPYVLRNDITYTDDIVENSLNGNISKVYENEQVGERTVYHRAEPIINWWFTSQKLHFDQINNYKSVKSINLNLNESAQIKLSTKAYRDMSHPEQDDVFDVKVNEIRTFVKRVNLMHVMHFQYRLENDRYVEVPQQFKLNSLSIKYEVKERIR